MALPGVGQLHSCLWATLAIPGVFVGFHAPLCQGASQGEGLLALA